MPEAPVVAKVTPKVTKKPAIDIDKLLKKAQGSYGKKENGVAQQLSSGSSIKNPSKDSDFVLWTKGPHWETLTHTRGIAFGRIVQISGKPDSGKSTHAAVFMKEAQDQGCLVVLWDSEKKFSPNRFAKIGGDPESLLCIRTTKIEDGAIAVAKLVDACRESYPDKKVLVVWDSVGASVNSSEDNEDTENMSKQPGVTAKEVSFAVRKFVKLMDKHMDRETGEEQVATLVINQVYANIGSPGQTEKGGGELFYLSSLIVQLSRKGNLTRTRGGEKYKYGIVSRAVVKKNHMFDGDECISEMDIVVSSDGILLAKDAKSFDDIKGWDDENSSDEE
jgi:RecA/RadA recombinase